MGQETNKPEVASPVIADRRLFLTADQRVVEEGDPDAAFQLAAPGAKIEPAEVSRLGLETKDGKVSQKKPPVGGVPVAGGAVLTPRGAVEAAVKDRLKADWEVRVQEETDKEMAKLEGASEDPGTASALALNRAGVISREALTRRGESAGNPEADRSAEAVEKALKSAPAQGEHEPQKTGKRGDNKKK